MASQKSISFLFLLLLISGSSAALGKRIRYRNKPCKSLVVYYHEIDYQKEKNNARDSTAVLVGSPDRGNDSTILGGRVFFGDLFAFDNPITLDDNPKSTPVGRANGFFVGDSKSTFSTWFGMSFAFNSTEYKGSIVLQGSQNTVLKTRDIVVTGGTGDFFLARGIATLSTDTIDAATNYFRLRFHINLYECW